MWSKQFSNENELPDAVKACGNHIEHSGVWWCATRNHKGTKLKAAGMQLNTECA